MQQWRITEGICITQGVEGYPTYGVAVTLPDGGEWAWADVDIDRSIVRQLVCRLQAAQPRRCHFEELVLDFIEEMAGKV